MYGIATCTKNAGRAGRKACSDAAHPVGGLSCRPHGRQRHRVCPLTFAAHRCAGALGAGSFVPQRSRAADACRPAHDPSDNYGRSVARCRCALGDGGWFALPQSRRRDRRDLGRSARTRFYRDKAACDARRGCGCLMLVDPACGQPRPQCGPRPVARCHPSVCPKPARCPSPRCGALVTGSVPFAAQEAWTMGGRL